MLIDCPACGRQVSEAAGACPACGHPLGPPEPSVHGSQILDQKLIEAAAQARQRGGRIVVDSRSETEAVFTFVKTPNHVLHGILTVLTAGIWLIVWLVVAAGGGHKETWKIVVNPDGTCQVGQI